MASQAFLWTTLPNGIEGHTLKFSAFVAPRLDPQHGDGSPGTLAEFTFGNWATLMHSLSVSVIADSHPTPIPATLDPTSPPLDPSLWSLIFPQTMAVQPFRFSDLGTGVEVVSYPVSLVNGTITGVWGGVIGITPPRGLVPIGGVSPVGNPPGTGNGNGGGSCCDCHCDDDGHHHHHCGGDDCDCDDHHNHRHHHHHHRHHHCDPGCDHGGQGGHGEHGGSGGPHPWLTPAAGGSGTTLNTLEQFLSTINGLETTLINFGMTPKLSSGETAASVLSRMGVTLTPTQRAFFDYQRFFNRYGYVTPASPPSGPVAGWTDRAIAPGAATSTIEFHNVVSLLGDYPVLLRRLGLIRDFTIDASILGSQTTGLTLAVSYPTPGGPATTINYSPKTMAKIDRGARWFRAADRPGTTVADGMITFDDATTFSVIQGQVDGSAAKAVDLAVNEQYRVNPTLPRYVKVGGTYETFPAGHFAGMETCAAIDAETDLPALRSGVQLVQNGRGAALENVFARQAQFNSAIGSAVLYSDDIMRGYRVDVNDRGNWRSLCARTGTVSIQLGAQTATGTLNDEGYVKAASATKKDAFPWELFVHESLFGWDSWSLVAPHPGRTVSDPTDQGYSSAKHVKKLENTNLDASNTPQSFPFTVTSDIAATPGTLPRLRFGATYSFRARAVDLAGNSLPLSGVPTDHATPPWTYTRFEPLLPPAIVPKARFTLGESLEHVIIRAESPDVAVRFIAPPKTSQLEMETHGKLDALLSAGHFDAAYNLSAKESGTFTDPVFFATDPNAVFVTNDVNIPPLPVTSVPRGEILTTLHPQYQGGYMIYEGSSLPLPYLPDPLVTGVALYLDENSAAAIQHYAGPSWDTVAPIRFELHAGTGAPTATPGNATTPFVVTLPPATILEVDYSSTMRTSDLDLMWPWQNGGSASFSAEDAASGNVPQIAACRSLRLVHAVMKPLATASVTSMSLLKNPADSFVSITTGTATCHSQSTGELEIWTEWTETQDLLPNPPATGVARKTFAYRISPQYGSDNVSFPVAPTQAVVDPTTCGLPTGAPNARIDFGDTKYRSVQFRCTASTRYGEYYNPADIADPTKSTLVGDLSTSSYVVLSSARGPSPDVAYVVPTFGWTDTSATQRTRTGGSVRVYLNRPWFATGDGELLAVVVASVANGATDVGDTVRPYVTEMGYDPLYADNFGAGQFAGLEESLYTTVLSSSIVSKDASGNTPQTLSLAELGLGTGAPQVIAVGHTVHYSPERDLWYTDVELNIGNAYAPMVRLAVARYQPNSLAGFGFELSPVVRIDCVQLASQRTAGLARSGGALSVTVSGPSAPTLLGTTTSGPLTPGAGHVVTAMIESRPVGASDLEWAAVPAMAVTLTASLDTTTGQTTWTNSIASAPRTTSTTEYRVRIEEFEQFQADVGVGLRPVYIDTFTISI